MLSGSARRWLKSPAPWAARSNNTKVADTSFTAIPRCCLKNPCKPWGIGYSEVDQSPISPSPKELALTTATFPILAIDLGKYKSVACWYAPASGEVGFANFSTRRANLQRLLAGRRPAVVIEPAP